MIEKKISNFNYKEKSIENNFFDAGKFYKICFRRKKLFIFTSLFIILCGTISTTNQRLRNPIYRGEFKLLISDPIRSTSADNSGLNNSFKSLINNNSELELATLIEVLLSNKVLGPIALKYKFTTKDLARKIDIKPVFNKAGRSNGVLKISSELNNPEKLENLLNDVSKAYISSSLEQRQKKLIEGLDFLSSQEPILQNRLKSIQNELLIFRKKYNFISPDDDSKVLKDSIFEHESEIDIIDLQLKQINKDRRDLSEGKLLIKNSKEFKNNKYDQLDIEDPNLSVLKEFDELNQKISEARLIFKPNSRTIVALENKLLLLKPKVINSQNSVIDRKESDLKSKKANLKLRISELQETFKFKPNIQKEYDDIQFKLEYARLNLSSLISAKEEYQLSLAQTTIPWKIINPTNVESTPYKPSIPFNLATSVIFALFTSALIVFLRERFDYVFHNIEELEDEISIPIFGQIPYLSTFEGLRDNKKYVLDLLDNSTSSLNSGISNEELINKNYERFSYQEAYRNLYTSLRFLSNEEKSNLIAITSSLPAEGKSIFIIILAKTLAELGKNVLLIDLDLRKPQLHHRLGINNLRGFSDLFYNTKLSWKDLKQTVKGYPSWDVITSGKEPPNPVTNLSSDKFNQIINDIKNAGKYEYILFDTPPSLGFPDATLISRNTDLLLLIVGLNFVSKDIPLKVIKKINSSGLDISGIVSNSLKFSKISNKENIDYYSDYVKDNNFEDNKEIQIESSNNKIDFLKKVFIQNINKFFEWVDK